MRPVSGDLQYNGRASKEMRVKKIDEEVEEKRKGGWPGVIDLLEIH